MAYSGYALPPAGGSRHGYSHSYNGIHLSPGKSAYNAFPSSNGHLVKKAASNNSLYTHKETSRETSRDTSPMPSPGPEYNNHKEYVACDQNMSAFQENSHLHQHKYNKSWSPMKCRPRGDSDLGRATNLASSAYTPTLESIPAAPASWFSLPEALTSLLVPLPYVLASASYSSMSRENTSDFPPLSVYAQARSRSSGVMEACILTSSTLLLVGILGKMQSSDRMLDRRKGSAGIHLAPSSLLKASSFKAMAVRSLSLCLPLYASMQLGGMRTGLVLLVAIAADSTCADDSVIPSLQGLRDLWSSKVATSAIIVLSFITDELGLTINTPLKDVMLGYLALTISVFVLQPPLPIVSVAKNTRFDSKAPSSVSGSISQLRYRRESMRPTATSQLTCSVDDTNITLAAGIILALVTILLSVVLATSPSLSASAILLITLTVASMASAIFLSVPSTLRSQGKAGLALGCLMTASCSFLFSPSMWPGTVCNGGLSALSFLSVLYDTNGAPAHKHSHDDHDHAHNVHTHHVHQHTEDGPSAFTNFLMAQCEPGSLIFGILSEKDSRRIAYFTVLNFGFMLVQGAYGYLSGSLGLLSDTVHMFFDCLGLVVGLGAAVASKWPTSPEKPYGWGKLNTLSGFGNGIFLMLVSVEFVWEATEGILEGTELRHVQELMVVSTLGLLVNLVGLFAFGHAHAGHDHGHSHSEDHGHSHSHGHDHSHVHTNGHIHSHGCDEGDEHKHGAAKGRDHQHHNDNMHGIFLHVAADAGGSLAVIISTALTLWKPWYLWDPLATIIIAILIFAAAVPLVVSSGQKLLLVIPDDLEYNIKNTLQELGELRGVMGYAAPRFWVDDKESADESHDHHHHGHDHGAGGGKQKIMGVIHVIAAPQADLDDVRARVEDFFNSRRMDLVIHVEREADGQCWCDGGGAPRSS